MQFNICVYLEAETVAIHERTIDEILFFRLEKLSAKENPFAEEDDFRIQALLKCVTLAKINKEDVNEGERAEARQLSEEQED